jgi:hypothetical protein
MEHKEHLADLHKQALAKAEDYLKTKEGLKDEDKEKLHTAKEEWQAAWNKFLETLVYLERLEI